jgi:uncharacterized membrane protein
MDKLLKPARIIFSLGMLALGVVCFIVKDFIVGRPPAWRVALEINPALAYVSGSLIILAALAIILHRKAALAAVLIALIIFLLSVVRHLVQFNDWLNAYKAMALFGGSLIVACSFFKEDPKITNEFSVSERMIINIIVVGCLFLAVFLCASGYAHFKFAEFVENFIPAYIPFRKFWAYFCGVCLVTGGVGLLIHQTKKWAALFSGVMIFGWFVLLHIPRFLANVNDPSDRMGLCESFTFAGIFFVLAGMHATKE